MSDWTKLRARAHGLLWFGEDQKDRWSISDPESDRLAEACQRLRPKTVAISGALVKFSPEEKQRNDDMYVILRVVSDYQHLTTYELGVEHILKKLRIIWRALREVEKGKPDETDR